MSVPRDTGELDRLQGAGWIAGSRTDIKVKCNLAGEKVLLIDKVKASYKEKKRQQRSDRCSLSILQEMPLFVILELWSWEEGNLKRTRELTRDCLEQKAKSTESSSAGSKGRARL